ncbi:putative porin [Arcticibacter eurypsychrophilus]|uniref:putative porin n=1 Tax=Arcticibacter eurypsychrophilus TaxID=1434752 RepID=UPI00084CFC79|nr:putative porin [Arcticibacter eurypsychrophilus]
MKYILTVLLGLFLFGNNVAMAQVRPPATPRTADAELDSLRKIEEGGRDTVIFNATYIRYTNLDLLKDSTQTEPIDTTLRHFQNYNIMNQPEAPTANLGNLGLPYNDLLFDPSKSIGFDAGFHSMDRYKLTQDSIKYYRARTPFTSLYYVNGSTTEQVFKVIHSQNIKPNWNIGGNYFRIGARGIYRNQNSDHLNAAIFSWYESPTKRYNILVNGLFNTLKTEENGSMVSNDIFNSTNTLGAQEESVKLNNTSDPTRQTYNQKSFFLKQFYYLGRIDTTGKNADSKILPTQRVSHSLLYSAEQYKFYKKEADTYNVFPDLNSEIDLVQDSTHIRNLRNEFMYSFYLRGRSVSFLKNEVKLDLGIQHDLYWYDQMGFSTSFQNIMLKANAGYRFSDRISLNANVQQIAQGRNAGDYLYDAKAQIRLSRSVGKIILGAYSQNKSPEQFFDRLNYTYHQWSNSFDKTKINNLSFAYLNSKFKLQAKAEYFLVTDYLYLAETPFVNEIEPLQMNSDINLLKLTLSKSFKVGKFNMENYVVYQKTDYQDLLSTPEFYTYNSFYFSNTYFKKALSGDIGFDVRMNTPYTASSYAINVSQFYNGYNVKYASYPIVDVWARFALRRANIFVRYDYANQGLLSKGYYTVNRYPMPNSLFKLGVSWSFYD